MAAAPDLVDDPDRPYDPKDPVAVAKFWSEAKIGVRGKRGPQKSPTKVAITVRYSPEVIDYFKSTGDGWQTLMNDALCDYVNSHKVV